MVELPARFIENDVIVRVTIGDRGLDFTLDTGSDAIALDSDVARQLGLKLRNRHSEVNAGRHTAATTVIPEMRIGPLTMRNIVTDVVPNGFEESPEVKSVGLLGFDFIATLGIIIDYQHRRVTAMPASDYVAPAGTPSFPLDIRLGSNTPEVTVKLNRAVAERFVFDTGGGGTFLIFDAFARRHPEAVVDARHAGAQSDPVRYYGIGGTFDTAPYAIEDFQFANINFKNFIGYRVMSAKSYADGSDGIIGNNLMRLFTVGINYTDGRIDLVPNDAGRHAMGIR